jgi:hypothetical protein
MRSVLHYGPHTRAVTIFVTRFTQSLSQIVASIADLVASGWSGCYGSSPVLRDRWQSAKAELCITLVRSSKWRPQNSLEVVSNDPVAFTRRSFQASSVKDMHLATLIFNDTGALQHAGVIANGRTLRTQHGSKILLREHKLVLLGSIMAL